MIQLIVSNDIKLSRKGLPTSVTTRLKGRLVMKNPQYEENEKYDRWNGDTQEWLYFIEQDEQYFYMPRGFISQLKAILKRFGVKYKLIDYTRRLEPVEFNFNGKLHDYQQKAVTEVLKKRFGILQAPTGSGKTVMALKAIAERKQPCLIIVHTKELLYQWRDRASEFLDITLGEIGLIGDCHKSIGDRLTIAIVNSLYKRAHEVRDHIGFLIVDECHRTPSRTFTEAVSAFDSGYMLGLSATPYRRDKLTKVIYLHIGDRVHEIKSQELQEQGRIMTASLRARETEFDYLYQDDYQDMITALVNDHDRNELILSDVTELASNGNGIALVISDRKEHCNYLHERLQAEGIETRLLTGSIPKKERKTIVQELGQGRIKALVSTAQLISEGFDCKGLSSIFLTTPIRFTGKVKQAVGRILRTAQGKDEAIIYDYVDKAGILQNSFKSRHVAYEAIGIK